MIVLVYYCVPLSVLYVFVAEQLVHALYRCNHLRHNHTVYEVGSI